jgi:hypothetical protein
MMEPRRLLEDSISDVERALLNAGATYRCSGATRAKTLAALGLAGSAALSAGAVSLSTTSLVAKLGWPKLILAVTALGAATALPIGYYVWHQRTSQLAQVNAIAVTPADNALQDTRNPGEPGAMQAPEQVTAASDDVGAKSAVAPKVESKGEASSAALSEELNALDGVRTLLARGDAAGALSHLDTYNRTFPKGRLQLEAEVLRIDALTKSGQTDLAKKRAQAFLSKHPNSVLASRVRALL